MKRNPTKITVEDDDGVEHTLPSKFAVCETCEGRGTHVNRNIDGNGIGADEWAEWDDEDRHAYLSGRYDVSCEECGGARVVLVVDEERCSSELLELYACRASEASECDAIQRAERAAGA